MWGSIIIWHRRKVLNYSGYSSTNKLYFSVLRNRPTPQHPSGDGVKTNMGARRKLGIIPNLPDRRQDRKGRCTVEENYFSRCIQIRRLWTTLFTSTYRKRKKIFADDSYWLPKVILSGCTPYDIWLPHFSSKWANAWVKWVPLFWIAPIEFLWSLLSEPCEEAFARTNWNWCSDHL